MALLPALLGSCRTDFIAALGADYTTPPPEIETLKLEGFERDGAAIAVARVLGRTLAFVADEDEDAVHTVDLDQRLEIARTDLDGRPSALLVLPDGRLAVTLRDDASIAVLSMIAPNQPLLLRASINAADEPVALATSPDSKTLWVASGVGQSLDGYALETLSKTASVALQREPRAVTISSDGARAFVGYMSETGVSAIDLATRGATFVDVTAAGKFTRQTFALVRVDDKILAPLQLVTPGEPMVISSGYGSSVEPPVEFDLAVLDGRTGIGSTMGFARSSERDCRLPRGAAVDDKGNIAVACLGSNAIQVYNAKSELPSAATTYRAMQIAGPTAVAFDPVHHTFVGLASFTRRVQVIAEKKSIPIALSHAEGKGLPPDAAEGRKLFFAANDDRISADGRACASCHADGRDDGLVWPTPKGPRQTVLLAGRLARPAPYGWDGKHESLAAHIKVTMANLQGTGLPATAIDKLAAYLVRLPAPPKRDHDLSPEEKKGEALFASSKTGCASCHADNAAFDVASATKVDKSKMFLAPSLRHVAASAPYFHDGRYPTLASMLRAKDNAMAPTADLPDDELKALEAYLRTL